MKLAYIDSSVWIARVEGLPVHKRTIDVCLNDLSKEGWSFCASEAVLLEVMAKPYRDRNTSVIQAYHEVFEPATILKGFANLFENALIITHNENLKAMDAIHVSIAFHCGCKRFVSTDSHFKNLSLIVPVWIDLRTS